MFEHTCELKIKRGVWLDLRYRVIESLSTTGDIVHTSYGLVCSSTTPDGKINETVILDISADLDYVEALAKAFGLGKVLPEHLHDFAVCCLL